MGSDGNTIYISVKTDPAGGGDDFVDESESLSEDERDLILARLYYSTSTVPTSKPNPLPEKPSNESSPKGKKITFDEYLSEPDIPSSTNEQTSKNKKKIPFDEYVDTQPGVPSTKFTFELDLDNLPSPPIPTAVQEAPSLDEDDKEYVVITPSSSSTNLSFIIAADTLLLQ
jgi:hypothetical protein